MEDLSGRAAWIVSTLGELFPVTLHRSPCNAYYFIKGYVCVYKTRPITLRKKNYFCGIKYLL